MKLNPLATFATLMMTGILTSNAHAEERSSFLPPPNEVAEPSADLNASLGLEDEKTGMCYPCHYRPYRPVYSYPINPCGVGTGCYSPYYAQPGYPAYNYNYNYNYGYGSYYGTSMPAYQANPYGYPGVAPIGNPGYAPMGNPNYITPINFAPTGAPVNPYPGAPVNPYLGLYGENDFQTQPVNDPYYP